MKNYTDPELDIILFSAREILADEIRWSVGCCDGELAYLDECDGEVE